MSTRIQNFKIFIITLICVLVFGTGLLITNKYLTNDKQELKNYAKNKEAFDYNVVLDYTIINTERVLSGEQIYLKEEEHQLYKQTIYLSFLKKISTLAFQDRDIKESDNFYESKYSTETVMTNIASKYKDIKNKHIVNYLNDIEYNDRYVIVNNTYLLNSQDSYEYIKEVIYFVNPKTYVVEKGLEIDFKYNYINDDLKYSKAHSIENNILSIINNILKDSINLYNNLNSKKAILTEKIETEYGFKVDKMYIVNTNTIKASSFGDKNIVQYSY